MPKTTKIAISLPDEMLTAVEQERRESGESRSEFFRRAVERLLKQNQESSAVKEYIRGYREVPESADEIEAAHRIGGAVLAEEPWK